MSEVGALIVKLQAETAQFREDMGKVKGDLDDLKGKSGDAGRGIKTSMTEARGGLMLVEESVGVKLPRHLTNLIAQIPGVGAAFAVMLPIAGVVVAIEIISKLVQEHHKLLEEQDKIQSAQAGLSGTIGTTMRGLQEKLLQAGKAADELSGNHLAAVKKELELIDDQSLTELAQTFDTLARSAEASFATLKAHWYEFSAGSEGAKHSLETFQAQYEMLLNTGKSGEANKLLDDKITRERTILNLQEQAASTEGSGMQQMARRANAIKAMVALTGQVVDYDDKALSSERDMVDVLQAQVTARSTIAQTAKIQKHTAQTKGNTTSLSEEAALQKLVTSGIEAHSQALIKLARAKAETTIAASKGGEDQSDEQQLAAKKAAIEGQRDDSIAAANVALAAKEAAYRADVKAAGANVEKKKELEAAWANDVQANSDAIVQFTADANKQIVAANRTAANDRAASDKEYGQTVANSALQIAELRSSLTRKAAEQDASNQLTLHHATYAQLLKAAQNAAQAETNAEVAGYNARIKALDQHDKNYAKNVEQLQTEVAKAELRGQAEQTKIITKAQHDQAMVIMEAQSRMRNALASDVAHSIVQNKNLGESFMQTGQQMAEQMIKNLLVSEMTADQTKLVNAKKAAGDSYTWAAGWGGPIAGGIAAAASFAAVMSFEVGGKIPGSGPVPITGHGGETVVTKALTDRVESSERNRSGGGGGGDTHIHYSPQVNAVDATSVDNMLTKHASVIQRHVAAAMRKSNR